MGDLKEQVKNAIIKAVNSDLERYFDYVSYQTDVADYFFRFDGTKRNDDEIETEINGEHVFIKVGWDDAMMGNDLNFKLSDVWADLYQYYNDDNETKTEFEWQQLTG